MKLLLTVSKAQELLRQQFRSRRLQQGLTQKGLARRSGVSLATLRKFEQKGLISLESLLKMAAVLDGLEDIVNALQSSEDESFASIEEVLAEKPKKKRQYGWRT